MSRVQRVARTIWMLLPLIVAVLVLIVVGIIPALYFGFVALRDGKVTQAETDKTKALAASGLKWLGWSLDLIPGITVERVASAPVPAVTAAPDKT